jgi:GNAT superfamily N-acetyltransferase
MLLDKKLKKEKIGSITSSKGLELTVWDAPLNRNECYSLFLETLAELERKEWIVNPLIPDSWRYRVVYACLDQQPVGGIAYEIQEEINQGWIYLSFVDPEFRGQRINELLHPFVEEICRQEKCIVLSSHVNLENQARLNSAKRADFKPEFYLYHKTI